MQAGFGPFIIVWLTQQTWTLGAIGLALSIGTFAALLFQMPAGLLVDQFHRKRGITAAALLGLAASAVMLCLTPSTPLIWGAQVAHALASCVMTPALAALTLSLCGHDGFSARLGINVRYASLGNAASAGLLGLAASVVSVQAVFIVTAGLVVPAIVALLMIRERDQTVPADDHMALVHPAERAERPWAIFRHPALHIFAVAAVLFQFANAALLTTALNGLTRQGDAPGYLVSATIILPQVITAIISPWAGRLAQRLGRRRITIAGFAAVPMRAILFAVLPGAVPMTVFQALDGVSAAVFGLMLPLIAADVTKETGHLNLAIGALGLAGGLGATVSTLAAGGIDDRFGETATFLMLALAGMAGTVLLAIWMPETKPPLEKLA